jgi:hypothetical protein
VRSSGSRYTKVDMREEIILIVGPVSGLRSCEEVEKGHAKVSCPRWEYIQVHSLKSVYSVPCAWVKPDGSIKKSFLFSQLLKRAAMFVFGFVCIQTE